jgi:hypothetical protein
MINETQKIETMLCCRLLYIVVIGGTAYTEELLALSKKVIEEPLEGMTLDKSRKLQRRCLRIERMLIQPLVEKAHGSKVALVVYHFLNRLIDEDYIEVPEGSNFAILADVLFNLIPIHLPTESEDFEKVNKSAKKVANFWRDKLGGMGYFK